MVNTRRKESNGSTEGPGLRTRGSLRLIKPEPEESHSSSGNESDCEFSGDRPTLKSTAPLPSRQLRSRFGYTTRKYNPRPLRSSHKRISLDERRTLTLYSHKMHDDSDFEQGQDSEEEIFKRLRGERSRHLIRMNRIQRRTALSLRPVSQECYADPHSPLHFNSDSESRVLRNKRKRPINMSWLDDSQMHKVGYPNLHAGYSEEDSRDATVAHNKIEITRRITRRGNNLSLRHEVKTPKYLYDYGVNEGPRRLRRSIQKDVITQDMVVARRTPADKENKKDDSIADRLNGRPRRSRNLNYVEDTGRSEDVEIENPNKEADEPKVNGNTAKKEKQSEEEEEEEEVKKNESSDIEDEREEKELPVTTLRTTRNRSGGIRNNMLPNSNYQHGTVPADRTRKVIGRIDSSSESEEEGRKYSLRDRRPKAAPKTMQQSVLRTKGIRTRFTRRRQDVSISSDSSSSDVCRGKPPKSPHHSKNEKMRTGAGGSTKIVPIKPETLDNSIRFNSIGGLDSHIQCLKEMILLPMMYPEVFKQFHIQPPRGVLFHGPPGTGKTLIARALANECSFGKRKVSFFLRKGADLLSKWIGESEKQLRLLFEQAAEMKPSIIFFDELDGLAPVRSSRQDQVHASIVSTLLALMDGLSDRGEVIVIGATNRIDAIDPALRRPGRFDRELFFPLPSNEEREEILNVHTSLWTKPPTKKLLEYLAENTVGYCGSDLRALCSEAVIQSFRRTYPQVYNSECRLLLQPENVKVEKVDFMRAKSSLVPASHRITQGLGRKLFPILEPILQDPLKRSLNLLQRSFPHGLSTALAKVKLSPNVRPAQLIITGNGSEHGQTSHLAPAILYKMEHIHAYMLNLVMLYQETSRSTEEALIQVFNEARKNIPSIIYIPSIDKWWLLVSETVRAIFKSQLTTLDPNIPILFFATSETVYSSLPPEIQKLFSHYRKEVLELKPPSAEMRKLFFKPLIVDGSLKSVRNNRKLPKTPPPLPRAATPPPPPLDEEQARKLFEMEEHTLRELRIFLRDMCKKLANNKLFFMFTKPVDTEEVPDYTNIIKQPMDLETMMTKVDFHRYECAKDFLNDIELICQNALEYNPARTSADKQIRHRACSLRDYAYTLIKTEMDTDFEDKCEAISSKRRQRKHCPTKYLPPYINTPEAREEILNAEGQIENIQDLTSKSGGKLENRPTYRKRRSMWQKGHIKKKIRRITENSHVQNDEKASSESDSKDGEGKAKSARLPKAGLLNASDKKESQLVEATSPLTINCDIKDTKMDILTPLQSPKRRLSDILSPSELLDNHLDFDDVDEALNETATDILNAKQVECSVIELEKVLDTAVKITEGFSLTSLLDLYNQLSRIVKKYSRTHVRTTLPKELSKEIARFKKEGAAEYKANLSP